MASLDKLTLHHILTVGVVVAFETAKTILAYKSYNSKAAYATVLWVCGVAITPGCVRSCKLASRHTRSSFCLNVNFIQCVQRLRLYDESLVPQRS